MTHHADQGTNPRFLRSAACDSKELARILMQETCRLVQVDMIYQATRGELAFLSRTGSAQRSTTRLLLSRN
eukprot:CAMPEP_0183333030 /NCGR_PEP_ID=MMETSP0164_2-20130417/2039_1 /TAXON_ID=221442 /ORGANISM="Coccolithus pelagicus ssp braarudi, Strain PLY182g" /LENGTH=70 /DNA_ID=CAMNT_0025501855 /DNA_START=370 /DNA_END=582 /DNA_ORIENTATION=+